MPLALVMIRASFVVGGCNVIVVREQIAIIHKCSLVHNAKVQGADVASGKSS